VAGDGQRADERLRPRAVGDMGNQHAVANLIDDRLRCQPDPVGEEQRMLELGDRAADGIGIHDRQAERGGRHERVGDARTPELTGDDGADVAADLVGDRPDGECARVLSRERPVAVETLVAGHEPADTVRAGDEGIAGELVGGREHHNPSFVVDAPQECAPLLKLAAPAASHHSRTDQDVVDLLPAQCPHAASIPSRPASSAFLHPLAYRHPYTSSALRRPRAQRIITVTITTAASTTIITISVVLDDASFPAAETGSTKR